MPNFLVNGLDKQSVKVLSQEVSESLSKVIDCPIEAIVFSVNNSGEDCIIRNGAEINDLVYIHVEWFERSAEVKDAITKQMSDAIFKLQRPNNIPIQTVDVIYIGFDRANYCRINRAENN